MTRQSIICAKCKLNETPFRIAKSRQYRFLAKGQWTDWRIVSDATGYNSKWYMRFFEWMRRELNAKWFSLIGRIGKERKHQFDIGRLIERDELLTAPASGQLFCFANDLNWMYFNNKGSIELSVTEVPSNNDS